MNTVQEDMDQRRLKFEGKWMNVNFVSFEIETNYFKLVLKVDVTKDINLRHYIPKTPMKI